MTLSAATSDTIGLMLSGGLDSAVLLGHLVARGYRVQPFYVTTGCQWEPDERRSVSQLLDALNSRQIEPLVDLSMPVEDLYVGHWSTTGSSVPDAESPDEAVKLPARNPLLLLKPLIWCGQNDVASLAVATLSNNPFADATPDFFRLYQAAIAEGTGATVEILHPFAALSKNELLALGIGLPLHLTFSCLAPHNGSHCGDCNKCAERARVLRSLPNGDPTAYACGATAK